MFQPWRFQLHRAQRALDQGRLEEAARLLQEGNLREFLPAKRLLKQLAAQLAERAQQHAAHGQSAAGWHDLQAAVALGANSNQADQLRSQLTQRTLDEAAAYLAALDPSAARQRLESFQHAHGSSDALRRLHQAACRAETALQHAARGQFAQAAQDWQAAADLAPHLPTLASQADRSQQRADSYRVQAAELHRLLAAQQYSEVLRLADDMLAQAPRDPAARSARNRAWSAVGVSLASASSHAGLVAPPCGPRVVAPTPPRPLAREHHAMSPADPAAVPDVPPAARGIWWVDAVGGFLVCEGDQLVIGQPVGGHHVDIPILGDLSARHALLRRVGEGYLLVPLRPARLDDQPITGPVTLTSGQIITLGDSVRIRFTLPHPLSNTARLDLVSHHRTQPRTDAILLLGQSCVLGPSPQSHVVCRDWQRELVVFRQGDGLACRVAGPFEIDGRTCSDRAEITRKSSVRGEDFSLALEHLE